MAPHAPPDPTTDEALFHRYRTGDRDAFALLASRYEQALLGLAIGILGRREPALDAVQDAWVRVIRSAHTFSGRSTLRTWVYRILINACKDARSRSSFTDGAGRGGHSPPAGHESSQDTPAAPELRLALQSLDPDRRLLLLLCYHHNLTHPQAAEVLGIPLGTLKSRLNASLTELRARLRQEASR